MVRGGFGHGHARNIDMGAAAFKCRKHDIDRICPLFLFRVLQHFTHVIGVAKRDVALPGKNGFHLRTIIALWFLRQIGPQARQPCFGGIRPVMGDKG